MRFPDVERRRRLVRRHHHLHTAGDGLTAVRAVAAFHSSDPLTPYLGMWARVPGFRTELLDSLLYEERSLWRLHAMRRTLFLIPSDEASVVLAAASLEVARRERARLEGWLAPTLTGDPASTWLDRAASRVMDVLEIGGEWTTSQLAEAVPEIARKVRAGSGRWTAEVPVSSRLLYLMAMEGRVVRSRPVGSWRSSQYRWAAASTWWSDPPRPAEDVGQARLSLTRRYLATHGPATLSDLSWWTGWTIGRCRAMLAAAQAETVQLDSGEEGYVIAGDRDFAADGDGPAVTLLPGLDPSAMGWKEREWYLGANGPTLFDTNGNAGPSVWVDGRMVGGWGQRADGTVIYELLEDTDCNAVELVGQESAALTAWLDGAVVPVRFKSPLSRKLAAS